MSSIHSLLPSLLVAATVAFAIGTSVVLRDRAREQFVLFAVFCFNIGIFHLARFFHEYTHIEIFGWTAQTLGLVLPWAADRCFTSFIPSHGPSRRPRIQTAILIGLLTTQLFNLIVLIIGWPSGLQALSQTAWDFVAIGLDGYILVALLLVASRMWRASKQVKGTARSARLRYLFYASLIAIAFGSPAIPIVGPTVTGVYLYFVAQTLVRERLLDLPEIVARIMTLTLLVVSVSAFYALLLLWIPGTAGETSEFLFNIIVASFAVSVLIDPVRKEIEAWTESLLFRDRNELRSMLLRLRTRLLNVIDPQELVTRIIDSLRTSNRVTSAGFYLLDAQGTHMILTGGLGVAGPPRLDVARRRPLLERMQNGPVLRDVLQRERERSQPESKAELDEILETLAEVNASLVIPIIPAASEPDSLPEPMGALFIDNERLLEPFSREEVQLFENLAAQSAITLQNSAAYEKRKERDRMAALGEMAAGLAHEIRNPLGAIKGAVQVMQPQFQSSDPVTNEFLGVIVEEVDRLNRVVVQFLNYSRPYKGDPKEVNLHSVIQATLRLLEPAQLELITLSVSDELPKSSGDPEALRQVFHNLILNAHDAVLTDNGSDTKPSRKPQIWIEGSVRPRSLPSGDAVVITVRDNGPGLSPHTITHLFVPFHTTKSGGTGLGLPISQRIVENHNGAIEVTAAPKGGASFSVLLPVKSE